MSRSVNEILAPEVIIREVTRIQLPATMLSDLFGWGLSARDPSKQDKANTVDYDLREGSYDVYNRTQDIAPASVPGSSNTEIKPQPSGKVRFVIPRSAQQLSLKHEDLINRRMIGAPVTAVDQMGENYIARQQRTMAELVANMIEFQTAAMLRGSYMFDQFGDELRQGFSGGDVTIDYQIPAGNKNQLNMLGTGDIIAASWANTSTDIPAHIMAINDAMNALNGMGIEHAICRSSTFMYVLNNTKVAAQAGTVNTPFMSYDQVGPGRFRAVLRAIPWLTWHIVDYRLRIWDGSAYALTGLIGTDQVTFMPTPNPSWVQYYNGSEVVTEGPNGVMALRRGYYPYAYPSWNPSGWVLGQVHNGFPALYVPSAIATADVTP
jgi:hypothetical protein